MTQRNPGNAKGPGLPGLSMMTDVLSAYSSAWDKHIQALNEVWTDCTGADATVADWPKAWSKLLQTWSGSAQDICGLYMGHGGGSASAGSPFVTFVIDQSAETDAQPQRVPLPAGVDPTKLKATELVSLTKDGHPTLGNSVILLFHIDDCIEIHLSVPQKPKPDAGSYLSVVYESKAGDPMNPLTNPSNPPPRPVIATVLVVFLASPI